MTQTKRPEAKKPGKPTKSTAGRWIAAAVTALVVIVGASGCEAGRDQIPASTGPLPTVRGLEAPPATRATAGPPPTRRTGVRLAGQLEEFQGPDPTATLELPKTPAPTPTYEILAVTPGPTITKGAGSAPELLYPQKMGRALRERAENRLAATGANEQHLSLAAAGYAFLMITTETPGDADLVTETLEKEGSIQWTITTVRRDGKEFARVEAIVPEAAIARIQELEGVTEIEGMTGQEIVPLVRQGPEPIQTRNRIFVHIRVETTDVEAAAEVAEAMSYHRGRRISSDGRFAYGTVEIEAAIDLSERADVVRMEITRAQ